MTRQEQEFTSMLFVKELMDVRNNTALSFFKETVSLFNERLDNLIKDVQ